MPLLLLMPFVSFGLALELLVFRLPDAELDMAAIWALGELLFWLA